MKILNIPNYNNKSAKRNNVSANAQTAPAKVQSFGALVTEGDKLLHSFDYVLGKMDQMREFEQEYRHDNVYLHGLEMIIGTANKDVLTKLLKTTCFLHDVCSKGDEVIFERIVKGFKSNGFTHPQARPEIEFAALIQKNNEGKLPIEMCPPHSCIVGMIVDRVKNLATETAEIGAEKSMQLLNAHWNYLPKDFCETTMAILKKRINARQEIAMA